MTLRLLSGLTAAGVDAAVAQAVEDHTPGIELGYSERTSNYAAAAGGTITGLSLTVTGQGRPVDIEFRCKGVFHSAYPTTAALIDTTIVDASANIIGSSRIQVWSASDGPAVYIKARKVLTADVEYVFTVNVSQNTAGTHTFIGSAARPIYLMATSR
jgi:hypothetical protein